MQVLFGLSPSLVLLLVVFLGRPKPSRIQASHSKRPGTFSWIVRSLPHPYFAVCFITTQHKRKWRTSISCCNGIALSSSQSKSFSNSPPPETPIYNEGDRAFYSSTRETAPSSCEIKQNLSSTPPPPSFGWLFRCPKNSRLFTSFRFIFTHFYVILCQPTNTIL